MNKFLKVAVLALTLGAGGCTVTKAITAFLDKAVASVIAGAQDLCGLQAEAPGILALLQSLGIKTSAQIPAVINRVCAAANAVKPTTPAATFTFMTIPSSAVSFKVNGVTVTGRFVR